MSRASFKLALRGSRPTACRSPIAHRVPACLLLGLLSLAWDLSPTVRAQEPIFWFSVTTNGSPTVISLTPADAAEQRPRTGLVLWLDLEGNDRWRPASRWPPASESPPSTPTRATQQVAWSASRGESALNGPSVAVLTQPLEQLTGGEILRGVDPGELITPVHQQTRLDGRPTLRRMAREGSPPFPAEEYSLWSDSRELGKIRFPAGHASLRWTELTNLPDDIRTGLPPGRYALRGGPRAASRVFQVAAPELRLRLLAAADAWRQVVGAPSDPVYLQIAVDSFLAARDEDDQPSPYIADALDLLDEDAATKTKSQKPWPGHLHRLRAQLESQLRGDSLDDPTSKEDPRSSELDEDATEVAAIDHARNLLAQGRWREAAELLRDASVDPDERVKALASVYLAVIGSQSGQATAAQTSEAFEEAIAKIPSAQTADVFRARINYVTHLLSQVQDVLYGQSFQSASGVQGPFATAAAACVAVERQLTEMKKTAEVSEQHAAGRRAALSIQRARYSLLLADFIQLLDSALPAAERFTDGEQAAKRIAKTLLEQITQAVSKTIPLAEQAAAWELRARLAHRERNAIQAIVASQRAYDIHVERGSLTGLETATRLLGSASLMTGRQTSAADARQEQLAMAERHLEASRVLGEVLQARFLEDEVGVRMAGFFSRRVYVLEQLMELRIEQGRFADALAYCEEAKAQTLEHALAGKVERVPFLASDTSADPSPAPTQRSLAELLSKWTADTAAIEYYLTSERAWIFAISPRGDVRVVPVRDESGREISSSELLARLHPFLRQMDGAALKLLEEARATGKFDHTWQDQLQAFHKLLLPTEICDSIGTSPRLLIVPHHLLHYFPFAALVTRRDETMRGELEMPQPRFLIDEPHELNFAPSLAVWRLLRETSSEPMQEASVLGIGEFATARPLPGVERDLRSFRTAFGDRVKGTLTGQQATESATRKLLQERGLLFLATHGKNLPDDPLGSYLLCHAESGTDGRLTTAEILAGDVGASMVVMSACYSGLADRSPLPGDDLFGLQRAFLQRGAKTVVAGLWDVYDETGVLLMETFFNELAKGQGAPAALAIAQREFLAQRRKEGPGDPWIHPYFWAVYKSSGSERTRFAPAPAASKPGSP
ncbi:MAG: CHAT domain-containing protein [Pirellulales bacterium]